MRSFPAKDVQIAALAAAQHGVVTRSQLRTLGLSDTAITLSARSGRLHRLHRGVYAVGHAVLTREGRWMAAVLAAGKDAVLSHGTAATAWDLRPPGAGAIHVTVPGDPGRERRKGRSELEDRFFALCDEHGLPQPISNTIIEGEEVDFVWREPRLIVEVDGYRYHRSPSRFEDDRERDVRLTLAGWTVLRFTWTQVTTRSAWVAAAVGARLGGPPAP